MAAVGRVAAARRWGAAVGLGLDVYLVAHPDGETGEKYVLCRSAA